MAWRRLQPSLVLTRTRTYSSLRTSSDINEVLSKPTWSVRKTLSQTQRDSPTASTPEAEGITRSKLHHLLRLSALPLPSSQAEEDKMIKDLKRQLDFVRSIQAVDTKGVDPLVAIRDETKRGHEDSVIRLEDPEIVKALQQERRVGKRGRIVNVREDNGEPKSLDWDPLAQAGRRVGKYIAIDTAQD